MFSTIAIITLLSSIYAGPVAVPAVGGGQQNALPLQPAPILPNQQPNQPNVQGNQPNVQGNVQGNEGNVQENAQAIVPQGPTARQCNIQRNLP